MKTKLDSFKSTKIYVLRTSSFLVMDPKKECEVIISISLVRCCLLSPNFLSSSEATMNGILNMYCNFT